MTELIEKISSYNLFNNLLPGTLFALIGEKASSFTLTNDDLFVAFFLYYFYGIIIGRFGSLCLHPILKKLKIIKFVEYKDYLNALKQDPVINTLSTENNVYRNISSMLLCLGVLWGCGLAYEKFQICKDYGLFIAYLTAVFIFIFAYRKQTNFITKRIDNISKKDK